jgi:hypothetical protein
MMPAVAEGLGEKMMTTQPRTRTRPRTRQRSAGRVGVLLVDSRDGIEHHQQGQHARQTRDHGLQPVAQELDERSSFMAGRIGRSS